MTQGRGTTSSRRFPRKAEVRGPESGACSSAWKGAASQRSSPLERKREPWRSGGGSQEAVSAAGNWTAFETSRREEAHLAALRRQLPWEERVTATLGLLPGSPGQRPPQLEEPIQEPGRAISNRRLSLSSASPSRTLLALPVLARPCGGATAHKAASPLQLLQVGARLVGSQAVSSWPGTGHGVHPGGSGHRTSPARRGERIEVIALTAPRVSPAGGYGGGHLVSSRAYRPRRCTRGLSPHVGEGVISVSSSHPPNLVRFHSTAGPQARPFSSRGVSGAASTAHFPRHRPARRAPMAWATWRSPLARWNSPRRRAAGWDCLLVVISSSSLALSICLGPSAGRPTQATSRAS